MRFIVVIFSILFLGSAFAQSQVESSKKNVIEINPLLGANQGIGLDAEFLVSNSLSLGMSLNYFYQNPYDYHGVKAFRQMENSAPFLRYYFLSQIESGPFVGLRVNLFYSQAVIEDQNISSQYSSIYFAPTVHAGYRFSYGSFTVAAFIGGGGKTSSNCFPEDKIPSGVTDLSGWKNAREQLNKRLTLFQPDFGLTLGYLF
jgi:hypothetical protein